MFYQFTNGTYYSDRYLELENARRAARKHAEKTGKRVWVKLGNGMIADIIG